MDKTKELNYYILDGKERGEIVTKNISDGHHTFGDLYQQRAILFCTICNLYPSISWKSRNHFDENDPMYEGDFIAGIYTPRGQAAFHLKDKYWDMLHVSELDKAPRYDGYGSEDALMRIASLGELVGEMKARKKGKR